MAVTTDCVLTSVVYTRYHSGLKMEKCRLTPVHDLHWWLKAYSSIPPEHTLYVEQLIACRHLKRRYPDYSATDVMFELKASRSGLANFCNAELGISVSQYIYGVPVVDKLEGAFVEQVGRHHYVYANNEYHVVIGKRHRVMEKPICVVGGKTPPWISSYLLEILNQYYHYGTILALKLGDKDGKVDI